MSTISTNDQITLSFSVKDRKATAEWYKTHLGFEESLSVDEAGWTELKTNTPGVVLGLGDAETVAPGNCVPVFGVENVEEARTALEKANIRFDGDTMTIEGMVSLATFYDPDGNALMLAQDLSQ